jgi:hypothetical protein
LRSFPATSCEIGFPHQREPAIISHQEKKKMNQEKKPNRTRMCGSLHHLAIAICAFLPALPTPAPAQIIQGTGWTALTNEGPAATPAFQGESSAYVAWKGGSDNRIFFSNGPSGGWTQQDVIPGFLSTKAPAVAQSDYGLFFAVRGQSTNSTDNIYYTICTSDCFTTSPTFHIFGGGSGAAVVCQTTPTTVCPVTTGSPALASDGDTLYMAWAAPTTSGTLTIEYGAFSGSSFTILGTVPDTVTTTKPTLSSSGGGTLYLAWTDGTNAYASYNNTPTCTTCWTTKQQINPAGTEVTVAPSLAFPYLAYTTTGTQGTYLNFANWDVSEGDWTPFSPPYPPTPPGPLANLAPALVYYIELTSCDTLSYSAVQVVYTLSDAEIYSSTIWDQTGSLLNCKM